MTTITLTTDSASTPFIDVLADGFPAEATTATLWRTAKGREFKVRGLVGVSTSGAVTVRDYEAPFGVVSSYRAQQFDAAGNFLSWSSPVSITLPLPPVNTAWVHNPLDPSTSVRVTMLDSAAQTLSRPNDLEVLVVPGRSVGLTLSSTRRGLVGVVLDCYTATAADADLFEALFGDYDDDTIPIICVRTRPEMRLPPTLFVAVGSPAQSPTKVGGALWGVSGDEVSPPISGFITALLDYADFTAFYADYAAFTAAYTDYTEATRDYSIAGTA